jgi:hypothetical protein
MTKAVAPLIRRCFVAKKKPLQPGERNATGKFDRTDYSVVVKNRGTGPNPWSSALIGAKDTLIANTSGADTISMPF